MPAPRRGRRPESHRPSAHRLADRPGVRGRAALQAVLAVQDASTARTVAGRSTRPPLPEALSDEIVQRNAPYDEVTPCLDRRQLDASGGQLLQRFGLHQGEIVAASALAREGASSTLVAVAQQATSLNSLRCGYHPHGTFGLGGQRDKFDHADTLGP